MTLQTIPPVRDFEDLRAKNGDLLLCAWVTIPLVYTQLVEIVIHIYFLCTLLGMQVGE